MTVLNFQQVYVFTGIKFTLQCLFCTHVPMFCGKFPKLKLNDPPEISYQQWLIKLIVAGLQGEEVI